MCMHMCLFVWVHACLCMQIVCVRVLECLSVKRITIMLKRIQFVICRVPRHTDLDTYTNIDTDVSRDHKAPSEPPR